VRVAQVGVVGVRDPDGPERVAVRRGQPAVQESEPGLEDANRFVSLQYPGADFYRVVEIWVTAVTDTKELG